MDGLEALAVSCIAAGMHETSASAKSPKGVLSGELRLPALLTHS